jgi:putative PIN family toxin of toxin-antitoxin system
MKVVVDTNVLVSGVYFGGMPSRVLDAWRDGKYELVVSPDILDEYRRVGEELTARFPDVSLAPFLALLVMAAEIVEPPELSEQVSRDQDDEKFIACAVAAGCRFIVSGDKDLLEVSGHQGIKVVAPRDFLETVLHAGS